MLNIISRALLSKEITGPQKVAVNFVKGLDILQYPYVINQRLDACERLYIHDDIEALKQLKNLPKNIKVVVGPNLYVTPKVIRADIEFKNCVYVHPSRWATEFFREFGFTKCPLDFWPTGIDTKEFQPIAGEKKKVLIYLKQRETAELDFVTAIFNSQSIDFEVIYYGFYTEQQYMSALSQAKYIVWLGRQESQGIALQEALAMNVPMLVWDVLSIGHCTHGAIGYEFNEIESQCQNTTSAPYFDERCGLITKKPEELAEYITVMEKEYKNYQPRQFILENLSLEKQARELLKLYEKYFGLSLEEGFQAKQLEFGKWRNDKFFYKMFLKNKIYLKKIIKLIKKSLHK